jgi:hypothetical protein
MMSKQFKLAADQIRPIATGLGACFATDMVTVDGHPVRWMYRQTPDNSLDSGWRFFAGLETDGYLDEVGNTAVYDVNTIANYDPAIIPFLTAPVGSAFERQGEKFAAVEFELRDD